MRMRNLTVPFITEKNGAKQIGRVYTTPRNSSGTIIFGLWKRSIRASTTLLACLTFPTSISQPLRTSSEITSRIAAHATQRKLALLARRTSRKQVRTKQTVIASMIINSR